MKRFDGTQLVIVGMYVYELNKFSFGNEHRNVNKINKPEKKITKCCKLHWYVLKVETTCFSTFYNIKKNTFTW